MNTVAQVLIKYPESRDNDRLLCTMVWREELHAQGRDTNEMYVPDFFLNYLFTLTDAASITRSKRELQLTNPELRGEKWRANV